MHRTPALSAAQNRLCIACAAFPIGLFLAWFSASREPRDKDEATLSEMVYDWEYASGKIFFGTISITVIFLIGSFYQYNLPNVHMPRTEDQSQNSAMLRDVAALSLYVVGVVPVRVSDTLAAIVGGQTQALLHSCAAALAFVIFTYVEARLILLHPDLGERERWYRTVACSMMMTSMVLFGVDKGIYCLVDDNLWKELLRGWTFRFELAIGSAFVWQCQLIRYFSDEYLNEDEKGETCFKTVWPFPFAALLLIVPYDLYLRGYCVIEPGSCFILSVLQILGFILFTLLHFYLLQKATDYFVHSRYSAAEESPQVVSYGSAA